VNDGTHPGTRARPRLLADPPFDLPLPTGLRPAWKVITVAPLGLRHAVFGAAFLVLVGAWLPVVAITAALLGAQCWFSDRIALSAMGGGVEVGPEEEPGLYATLVRLCAQADLPKPALAVATAGAPGAFAAGRRPSRAVLCVTTGLTERLTDDEVEAVLARELSRLAHRDVIVIAVASLMAVLGALLMRISFRAALPGGPGWRSDPAYGAALAATVVFVYALGFLLVRALSRCRDLAADRAGATLTGRPSSLARALVKLDAAGAAIPTRDLRTLTTLDAVRSAGRGRRGRSLFCSHPNLQTRLDRLTELAITLEREG